jgi:archaetidylinositol phosphate synthase
LLAPLEKKVLHSIARSLPNWVNSDHLTAIGFIGMVFSGICYSLAQSTPLALVGAVLFLGINWFGDSLDGTVARVRNRQRPRYGFYVDHILDSFGTLCLIGGLGLSPYMSGTIAMGLVIAYFLLSIELYLATYCVGVFRLSFGIWGPTELRVVLAVGTFIMYEKPIVSIAGQQYLLCDVSGVVAMTGMLLMTIVNTVRNTIRLYNEERLP